MSKCRFRMNALRVCCYVIMFLNKRRIFLKSP